MIKVSIIIPIYNVEKYLRRCLDSIVNQTLKDIECLLINDGSPDQSQKIIDELGDVCWYIAEIANVLDVPFEEVLIKNIEKLKKRFPNGFEVEKSINRE